MDIESRGDSLVGASWAEFGLTTILVLLRVYTTLFLLSERANRFAKAATYCAILAWAIGLLNSIFVQLSVNNGMGRHLVDIPLTTLSSALKWSWAADAMSRLSIATGKVAVVLFINAIQDGVQMQWQRALLAFIAISNICINIVVVFTLFFQCSPPRKLWDMQVPGTCNLTKVNSDYGFFATAWGAASDLTLALYPTYLFFTLTLERRTKIGMSVLFGLGIFASACAAVTCYQLHVVTNTSDPTWIQTPLTQWGYTEMWVVIMAACIPPTMPYIKKMVPNMNTVLRSFHSSDKRSKDSKYYSADREHLQDQGEASRHDHTREQNDLRTQSESGWLEEQIPVEDLDRRGEAVGGQRIESDASKSGASEYG